MIEPLTIALGDRRYKVNRPWGAHEGLYNKTGRPSDVAIDSIGRLYVLNRFDRYVDPNGEPTIAVYEANGAPAYSLDIREVADGHGLSIGPKDNLVIVDRDRHVVRIFSKDGTPRLLLGQLNEPLRPFNHPTAARFSPDGEIFVTDGYGNSRVHRFSASGKLIGGWGTPGSGPGQFMTPHCLAFTLRREVVICDRENNRIQFFDLEGTYIREVGDLYHPMAVVVDSEGMVIVSDQIPRLSVFYPDGTLAGRCRPALNGGHGMCIDPEGNIYLSEMHVNRVTRLSRLL